jgi:pimeloyl-ACP methyl ester carboxylesterase
MTSVVRSADATRIAYTRIGFGRSAVIEHGGLGTSEAWQRVAELLSTRFRVFVVDRRRRGASGDSAAHSLDREVEDLEGSSRGCGTRRCASGSVVRRRGRS